MAKKPNLIDILLGPLPVAIVNRTLQLELEAGDVVLTPSNQKHGMNRHPVDYQRCLSHLGSVLANPAYFGDDFRNPDSFELIGYAPALGEKILIAINFEPDASGRYRVASFYPVSEEKIQGRRARGFLKIAAL